MDRPLWRIFLNVALLAFVAQRAAGVAMAYLAHANPLLIGALVLPCIAGVAAAIAVWVGRKMEGSLIALGATVVATAVIEVAVIGGIAAPSAIAQSMFAVLSVVGLIFLLRHMPEDE
jgi:hypothetical protein